jgi:hypothetical protein
MMMNHIKITSQEPPVDIAGSWIALQGHSLVYADLIRIKKKNAHKVSLELRNTLTAQEIKQYEINLISEPTFEEDTTVSIYDSNANLELFFSPSFAPQLWKIEKQNLQAISALDRSQTLLLIGKYQFYLQEKRRQIETAHLYPDRDQRSALKEVLKEIEPLVETIGLELPDRTSFFAVVQAAQEKLSRRHSQVLEEINRYGLVELGYLF